MWPVDLLPHDTLRLEVLDTSIRVFVIVGNAAVHPMTAIARPLEGQRATRTAAWRQGTSTKRPALLYWRGVIEIVPLATIANDVFVVVFLERLVTIPLAARGAEETLLALAAAPDTWRVVRVVDTTEITPDLSPAAWDTCLVDAFVLGIKRGGRVARNAN